MLLLLFFSVSHIIPDMKLPQIILDTNIIVSALRSQRGASFKRIKKLAAQEGISMNQFITLAASEKMSALMTVDYLKERAGRGSRQKFEAILANVPDVEPEEYDKL